jgi:hypothetical protein
MCVRATTAPSCSGFTISQIGAIIGRTPELTRRRDPNAHQECWRIYYGDVQIGAIAVRSGVPVYQDQWSWSLGFYPVSHRGEVAAGTAPTLEQARSEFEAAWRMLLPKLSEADFQAYRRQRTFVSWKYAMWETGCKLPTQVVDGRSRCSCGAEIGIADVERHVHAAHMEDYKRSADETAR